MSFETQIFEIDEIQKTAIREILFSENSFSIFCAIHCVFSITKIHFRFRLLNMELTFGPKNILRDIFDSNSVNSINVCGTKSDHR